MADSAPRSADPEAVARAFLAAYNAADFDALAGLFDEDVEVIHYNRPIHCHGREETLDLFRASADPEGALSERHFNPPVRILVHDRLALIEHVWEAQAVADVASLDAKAGETAKLELVSILTVDEHGRIVAYDEYG